MTIKIHYSHLRNVISIPTSPRRKLKFHRTGSVNITLVIIRYRDTPPTIIIIEITGDSEKDSRSNYEIRHLVYWFKPSYRSNPFLLLFSSNAAISLKESVCEKNGGVDFRLYGELSRVTSVRFNEGNEFATWRGVHLRNNVRHCARRTTGNAIITRCFCIRADVLLWAHA